MEPSIKLLLKTPVLVNHSNVKDRPMTLLVTRTTLFLFRKETVWVQVPLQEITIRVLSGMTHVGISHDAPSELKGQGFTVRGLSANQRALIAEARRNGNRQKECSD